MSLLPVIALVGRPNVGKSTLFNRLTKSRDALVANLSGLTRDRQYGQASFAGQSFIVIDTGGISGEDVGVDGKMAEQSLLAAKEADLVMFMTSAKEGIVSADHTIVKQLRLMEKPSLLIVNKTDGTKPHTTNEFFDLGFGEPMAIAATQNRGIQQLMKQAFELLGIVEEEPQAEVENAETSENFTVKDLVNKPEKIKLAIVGRPNVGKSTLINRMLGEERVVVYDQPGTTRDSIYIDMERHGEKFTLIDTAGIRRRGKVTQAVEKFSVVKTLQAINDANVVVMVLDGSEGITDQDMSLLGFIIDSGRSLVIAINKWDGLADEQREFVKTELPIRLQFASFAKTHFISALHGTGVGDLFSSVSKAFASAYLSMTTRKLTDLILEAQHKHAPPMVGGRRIKLRMAHVGGHNPPWIIIHGNQTSKLPMSYQRYLSNFFREKLKLVGTPVRFEFKSSHNPFKGKKSSLGDARKLSRDRMVKKIKKNEARKKRNK